MSTLANSPVNRLLAQNPETDGYAETSRYRGVPTHSMVTADGRTIRYTGRRFITAPDDDAFQLHKVEQGDRPDLLAYRYLGRPDSYWQLCDVNGVSAPWQLTNDLDRRIRVGAVGSQFAHAPTLKI